MPRPKTGETKVRHLRVGPVWEEAMAKAQAEGRTLTDVIVTHLNRYVSTPPRKHDREADK
jgi:hypothetical protein